MPEPSPPEARPARPRRWYRVTVGRLMVLMAVLGLALGVGAWMQRRSARFQAEADRHLDAWLEVSDPARPSAMADYHSTLIYKYRRAAESPWWPVAPDHFEPE